MKKTIKIKLVGFWNGFNPDENILIKCLRKKYDVQIVDEGQEYIICSVFGELYEYCKYTEPRIMYSGENYIPDFNLIDYSICSYPIDYLDRNFRMPVYFTAVMRLINKEKDYGAEFLKSKKYFANFIASHDSEYNIRGDFFKKLSKYKRVESCGSYLNNMPDGKCVTRDNKIEFQRKTKFTLCFESTKHEGFITEKIADAFYADTIPVYYGSSDVTTIFNEKAFINCSDYETFDEAIDKIIELDNDDDKYMAMIRQPIFVDKNYPNKLMSEFENFSYHIFDPPAESIYRRSRVYAPKGHENYLLKIKNRVDPNELSMRTLIRMLVKRLLKSKEQ